MNWLDIVIIVVAVLLGIAGLRQGIIKTVIGIAGLIGGIVLAGRYYDELAARLSPAGATWANIAAYAIILIALGEVTRQDLSALLPGQRQESVAPVGQERPRRDTSDS